MFLAALLDLDMGSAKATHNVDLFLLSALDNLVMHDLVLTNR